MGTGIGDPAAHPRQGIFADWIAHLLLAATSAINWAELPAVGLAGSFVWGGRGGDLNPRLPPCE
jgi:hypothetical protein